MTARKAMFRPRRRDSVERIPETLAAWFAGETQETPWAALIYPDYMLLYERWAQWASEHPGVQPPEGFEYIAGPPPEGFAGKSWAEAVENARSTAERGKRYGRRG